MTLRPDDDLPLDQGAGGAPDGPVPVEDLSGAEDGSTADVTARPDEDPDLRAHRTDVESSPTGHS